MRTTGCCLQKSDSMCPQFEIYIGQNVVAKVKMDQPINPRTFVLMNDLDFHRVRSYDQFLRHVITGPVASGRVTGRHGGAHIHVDVSVPFHDVLECGAVDIAFCVKKSLVSLCTTAAACVFEESSQVRLASNIFKLARASR